MIEFLGITAMDYLQELPPIERSYYEYVIEHGDRGYYDTIYPQSKRPLALKELGIIEQCTLISAKLNNFDPKYLRVLMRSESGWPGASVKANNGSSDLGIVQINPKVWDQEFSKLGIHLDWANVRDNSCANLYVAGVIFARRLKSASSASEALGNYHRYITKGNALSHISYRKKAIGHLIDIEKEFFNWRKAYDKVFQVASIDH